jgi:hypothetical protein
MLVNIFRAQGNRLVYSATVTTGQTHIATVDAGAMLFHDSIDLSAYAGDDAGSTPYLMGLYNSDGKAAFGYIGAVGAGESGVEKVTDGGLEAWTSDTNLTNWTETLVGTGTVNKESTIIHGGTYSANINVGATGSGTLISQPVSTTSGLLYKITSYAKADSGTPSFAYDFVFTQSGITLTTDYAEYSRYQTENTTTIRTFSWRAYSATGKILYTDDISVKALRDVPATGLHLHSTKNGTDRKMTSVTANFNPNAIVGIKIWRAL